MHGSVIDSFLFLPAAMPTALAVILVIKFMLVKFLHFRFVLGGEFTLRCNQPGIVHGPLLDGLFLLTVVMGPVGCTAVGVEVISIRVLIVPGCDVCSRVGLTSEVVSVSRYCVEWHAHWVLVEHCYWHHLLVIAVIGEFILSLWRNLLHR